MKNSRFTERKIVAILKQQEAGRATKELCREDGSAKSHFTTGRAGMAAWYPQTVKRLKHLKEENSRLKKMYTELSLDHYILKDVISKKGWGSAIKGS